MTVSLSNIAVSDSIHSSVQYELVRDFARLEELSRDWDRLCEGSHSEIFQKLGWARAYWRAWGANLSLCSFVLYDGSEVIGILPLASDGKTIRFLAEGDYNDVLCEESKAPSVLATLIEVLSTMQSTGTTCVLRNLSADSHIVRHFGCLPGELRQKALLSFACPCPSLVAETGPQIFANMARKDSLRRHEKKLQREGRLTFRHIESRGEIHEHLPRFFQQQIARRALLGQRSHFLDPRERAFYGGLVDELDPKSELRFAVLELNGKPVAYHFGFQLKQKLIWYQSGFDVDQWQCAPGEVLIKKLLEYACAAELHEVDFTIGGEQFKHRFTNVIRNNVDLQVEGPSRGVIVQSRRLKALTRGASRQLRERLKARPRLYKALKKAWIGTADFMARQRRTFRRVGLFPYARLAFKGLVTSAMLEKKEVFVFAISAEEPPQLLVAPLGEKLEISAGTLSQLALVSLEHPEEIPWSKLHIWRKQLETGDRLYSIRIRGEVAHLAWVTARQTITELRDEYEIPLSSPAIVIYSCWSSPGFREALGLPQALQLLLREVQRDERIEAYYVTTQPEARREIEAAGLRLCQRILKVRVFRVLRRNWVRANVPQNNAGNSWHSLSSSVG